MSKRPPALRKPTVTEPELEAAREKRVKDVIARDLRVLFVGINPGLYSGAVGHHFARPGNRFWPALAASGFTPRIFSPLEERELLSCGLGITNIVARTTASADELSPDELVKGATRLVAKVRRYRPRVVAVLGITAYRTGFERKEAALGLQEERIGNALVWVLPNPSGLNAHYQLSDLAREFTKLREAAFGDGAALIPRVATPRPPRPRTKRIEPGSRQKRRLRRRPS
jgi:TDG/mug DNA glycosylase family protein